MEDKLFSTILGQIYLMNNQLDTFRYFGAIIQNHKKNLENSKLEYNKPFPYKEYKTKLARQFELNQELDLGRSNEEVIDEDENGVEEELEFSEVMGV